MPQIDLSILNQRQTPAFYADVLANRPAAGFIGRIFVSTNTFEFYRDNGTGWDLIGGPGAGTITGSGAAGQVSFWNGASTITGSNDLFWDNVNGHLGIGTITPGTALTIAHDQNQIVQLNQTTATNDTKIAFQNSGTALWRIGNSYGAGTNRFVVTDAALNINRFSVLPSSGQTFVGDVVTSSGLFVVNSSSSDAHIVALGATAPSIRVRNAGTGASLQIGLGLATTTNNFIQGSTGGEFCIFNDSLTAQPILFGIKDVGSGNTLEAARISAARNFLVGTTVDAGNRLEVSGTARVSGLLTETNGALFINDTSVVRAAGTSTFNVGDGSTSNNATLRLIKNATANSANLFFRNVFSDITRLWLNASNNFEIANQSSSTVFATFFTATSNIGINTGTDAGFKLDVNGTGRVVGAFSTDNITVGQGAGTTYKTIFTSVGANPAIIQSIATIGSGSAANNVMQFRCFNGFNPTGQLTITGDGSNVFEQSSSPTLFASAIVAMNSTTKGFLPPRMTTAQKNLIGTPAAGLVVYDTTLNKLAVFTGVNWETVTSV